MKPQRITERSISTPLEARSSQTIVHATPDLYECSGNLLKTQEGVDPKQFHGKRNPQICQEEELYI